MYTSPVNMLTFVIPVRHPANASDWNDHMRRLAQTARSIAAQTDDRWRAVVVANNEAELPPLPHGFSVARVDFPANERHDMNGAEIEAVYDAVRWDKGRRLLAGLLAAPPSTFVMFVDDDDLVSRHLVAFAAKHAGENGWYVRDGYVWGDGGSAVYRYRDFSRFCGTSHIVRTDLYAAPPDASSATAAYVKRMLGSHVFIESHLREAGTPLAPLPFRGAVYRIGHAGAHSRSSSLRRHFFGRDIFVHPRALLSRLFRLRPLSRGLRRDFFG